MSIGLALITTSQPRNPSLVRTRHPTIYRASPKSATIPPAKRGVPYSRAMAIAVAAPPVETAPVVAAVAVPDDPAVPLVGLAVLEGEALLEATTAPSVSSLPHSLSRAVVHSNWAARSVPVALIQVSNQKRHISPGTVWTYRSISGFVPFLQLQV
jgi:hypothetical protein